MIIKLKEYRGHTISVDERGNFITQYRDEVIKKPTIRSMEKKIDTIEDSKIQPLTIMSVASTGNWHIMVTKPKLHTFTGVKTAKNVFGIDVHLYEGDRPYWGGTANMYEYNDQIFASLENLADEYNRVMGDINNRRVELVKQLKKLEVTDVVNLMTSDTE
jgi:hypothetical protein